MTRFNFTTDYRCPGDSYYEHTCDECGVLFKSPREWSTICKACWKQSQGFSAGTKPNQSTAAPSIPSEMLKRLIQLCHPDKHSASEASMKATQWLLDQRNGGR